MKRNLGITKGRTSILEKIIYFWSFYLRKRNRVIFKGDSNQWLKNEVYWETENVDNVGKI